MNRTWVPLAAGATGVLLPSAAWADAGPNEGSTGDTLAKSGKAVAAAGGLGLLCCLVVVGGIALAIVMIIRRRRR